MNGLRLVIPILITLLAACGGSGPDAADPGNGPVPPSGDCRVTVTDDFTENTRLWSGPEACDYYFPGDPGARKNWYVESGAEVEIQPGTVLRFGPNVTLQVREGGRLLAEGTAAERIVLEGSREEPGHWYGLCFGADNGESFLEYVDVRWGGNVPLTGQRICRGGIGGSGALGEPVHINNSTVSGSYTNGLNVHNLNLGTFADNAFFGNLEYGVNIEADQVLKLDGDSDYLGAESGIQNGRPYIYASGSISTPGPHSWQSLNAPYFVSDDESSYRPHNIMVRAGAELRLEAGVEILFNGLSQLSVTGNSLLVAEGTEANPVILSSALEQPGSWTGVQVDNSGARLEHVNILWAGRDTVYQGSLVIRREVGPGSYMRDVLVDGSAGCAVYFHNPDSSSPADFDEFEIEYGDGNEQGYCER